MCQACSRTPWRLCTLVIDAMEDGESRSVGSFSIQSWQKRGIVGLVTSGGLADTDEIIHRQHRP